jgi:hypothetical protein
MFSVLDPVLDQRTPRWDQGLASARDWHIGFAQRRALKEELAHARRVERPD